MSQPRRNSGSALVAVLVVTMLVALIAVGTLYHVRAEHAASAAGSRAEQAWAVAMSGIQLAAEVVRDARTEPGAWQSNPQLFYRRLVLYDGVDRWYFTVYSPAEDGSIRYGILDESSLFNVNRVSQEVLSKIPGVTEAVAQAIVAMRDAPGPIPEPPGQPNLHATLPDPLRLDRSGIFSGRLHNGNIATLDELLRIPGLHAGLLYGEDANFNLRLDPNENDGGESFPPDDADGVLDRGLAAYLTTWGVGASLDHEGRQQVDLNRVGESLSRLELPAGVTGYVEAVRQSVALEGLGTLSFRHPIDLLGAKSLLKTPQGEESEMESGVELDSLPKILDSCKAHALDRYISGRININTASAQVLELVPEIDAALALAIVRARGEIDFEARWTTAWLVTEDLVDAERFKNIAPWITARGLQFRLHVVGYGLPSGAYRTLQAVIDVGGSTPRIVYLRDTTRLGLPFALSDTVESIEWE